MAQNRFGKGFVKWIRKIVDMGSASKQRIFNLMLVDYCKTLAVGATLVLFFEHSGQTDIKAVAGGVIVVGLALATLIIRRL